MTTTHNADFGLSQNRALSLIDSVRTRIAQARVYHQTVSSLTALSDRDLRDLGLSRAMIRSIAKEAAKAV